MAELVKQWDNGGSLSVTYEGSGDGSAVFSSDTNEGIDREMSVRFVGGGESIERKVTQEGLRQPFGLSGGGVFRIAGGGRFGVLKVGGVEPDEPTLETYTRLTYIECNGQQYINTGYIVQEDDVLTIKYAVTEQESGRMFGCIDEQNNSIYWSLSNGVGYARFGNAKSTSINNGACSNYSVLRKGKASINTWETSMPYTGMPTTPLYLFAVCNADKSASNHAIIQCSEFSITSGDGGQKMLFIPHKRDCDGKVGMLEMISGMFYVNEATEADFIGGSELNIASGYELIESVAIDADKLFDIGAISNEDSIDIMFQRNDTSSSVYLYGIVNSGNTASCTAYMASNGAWRFGNQLVRPNTADTNVHRGNISNGLLMFDGKKTTFTKVSFKTLGSVVVGGYRDVDGSMLATFRGNVSFVRVSDRLDWIAARRKSDGEEGFWDCVTQTFVEPI